MFNRIYDGLPSTSAALILVVCLVAGGCSFPAAYGPPSAGTGVPPGCVSFPNEQPESVAWTADGRHFAMASSVELGGQAEDQISVFAWPELTRAVLYQSTDSLQTIAIDPTGQTVYFWTYGHAGPSSIWYVNGSGRAKILAQTDSGATGSIYWSAGGIVRVAQGDDPTILKVWRTDFSGKTSLVQQRDATMGALMTRDGQWLVVINKGGGSDPTGDSYTVVHAGTESTVTADGTGELLGMTQDRSSIVYRPLSDKGASGMLSLHVLPINGGPEKIASVPLPVAGPIAAMGMSDQGVLAYTDGRYQTSELCTATLRLGA